MRKLFGIFALLGVLLAAVACGNDEEFVIRCDIKGLGTRGLEMVYVTRSGISRLTFHPVDGKVDLRASSPQPTLVEVYTIDGTLLFSCVASNGDHMEVKMQLDDPSTLTLSGQNASRDYTAFVVEHDSLLTHGSDAEVNRMIAEAVRANPSNMMSTLLMVTRFRPDGDELLADSLLNEISSEARPFLGVRSFAAPIGEQVSTSARGEVRAFTIYNGKDTIVRYSPGMQSYALLVFDDKRIPDSISRRLRDLRKSLNKRRLQVVEVSFVPDSAVWHSIVDSDSAIWLQAWVPGGPSSAQVRRLAVPRTPYYIVADSLGRQCYRGSLFYAADTLLRSRLGLNAVKDTLGSCEN